METQFLANIREVDAIVHVVRCFEDPNVIHVDGSIDPLRDIETIDLELIFADLEVLERRISKTAKSARMDKEAAKELEFQERLKKLLEDGKDAILMELQNEDEEKWIAEYNLLTSKPVIYAANVAEDDLADDGANNSYVQSVREYAKEHNKRSVRHLRRDRAENFRTRRGWRKKCSSISWSYRVRPGKTDRSKLPSARPHELPYSRRG